MRLLRQVRLVALLLLLLSFIPLQADEARDLQEHLKHILLKHVVRIRNSYGDNHLSYDSQGNLLGSAEQDCPNATQLKVSKVEIKKNTLVLRGPRVVGSQEPGDEIQIDIELDPAQINEPAVMGILEKVFLTTKDIPKKEDIPGPVLKVRPAPGNTPGTSQSTEKIEKVEEGVTPPVAIYSPDPLYPDQAQKKKKREGDVILWVVIDEQGHPSQIKVARCIGAGLDEAAVQAVSQWKFKPARRNGQPVSVSINIDITFHLH
jgi:TonB family protein